MKFRKKPVVVEAIKWTGKNWDELEQLFPYDLTQLTKDGLISVDTVAGKTHACVGDWIISGVSDKVSVCKPDVFKATYEPVE